MQDMCDTVSETTDWVSQKIAAMKSRGYDPDIERLQEKAKIRLNFSSEIKENDVQEPIENDLEEKMKIQLNLSSKSEAEVKPIVDEIVEIQPNVCSEIGVKDDDKLNKDNSGEKAKIQLDFDHESKANEVKSNLEERTEIPLDLSSKSEAINRVKPNDADLEERAKIQPDLASKSEAIDEIKLNDDDLREKPKIDFSSDDEDATSESQPTTPTKCLNLSWYDRSEESSPASTKSSNSSTRTRPPIRGFETDVSILQRRQKQIDYGKNTKEYQQYITLIPKEKRESFHVKTPNKYLRYSRRSWDNQIRIWRKTLHKYDSNIDSDDEKKKVEEVMALLQPLLIPPTATAQENPSSSDEETK